MLSVMSRFLYIALLPWFAWLEPISCLDNGLAQTPPMGWMTWQRYRCTIDCQLYPYECISEWLIRNATDLLATKGYAKLGYEYVIVDDCWASRDRDKDGRLQPDPQRFPSGIKALAKYVHSRGLKFGIYGDIGRLTCEQYPGSEGHFETDTKTFAEWGVDYVKLDGCYTEGMNIDEKYPEFGRYLNKTGRPIVYSCSWPAYQTEPINWKSITEHCNLWRPYGDIQDSWETLLQITDFFGKREDLAQYAGPGHWNDPDMLLIGNFGLSKWQAEAQMAVWAVMAAPLIMSTDLANIEPEFKHILQNKRVIAINQDPLGIQGKLILSYKDINVWSRPISPKYDEHFSYAIAFMSNRSDGMPFLYTATLSDLGLHNPSGYVVDDLFRSSYTEDWLKPESKLEVRVFPSGVVFLLFRAVTTEEVKVLTPSHDSYTGGANTRSHSLELVFITLLLTVLQIAF